MVCPYPADMCNKEPCVILYNIMRLCVLSMFIVSKIYLVIYCAR